MNEYPLHLNVLENNIDGLKKQLSKVSKVIFFILFIY